MLSRFISAACTGMTSERKTTSSSSADSSTTIPMNSGSLAENVSDRSMNAAVRPPTYTAAPVPAEGMTSSRRWLTRLLVDALSGEVVGKTCRTAVSPAGLTRGGLTAPTPASP